MRIIFLYFLASFLIVSCHQPEVKTNSSTDVLSENTKEPAENNEENVLSKNLSNSAAKFAKANEKPEGWTSLEKSMFMKACLDASIEEMNQTKADHYCSCMLQKIEKLYPNAEDVSNMPEKTQLEIEKECLQ